MNTKKLESHLLKYLSKRKDLLVLTTNLSLELAFEADLFFITKDLEINEFELKISRGDFLKDASKISRSGVYKYDFLLGVKKLHQFYQEKRPNKFYYVAPHGMISKKEIVPEFGLIEVLDSGQVVMTKRAKKLHEIKTNNELCLRVARNFIIKTANSKKCQAG